MPHVSLESTINGIRNRLTYTLTFSSRTAYCFRSMSDLLSILLSSKMFDEWDSSNFGSSDIYLSAFFCSWAPPSATTGFFRDTFELLRLTFDFCDEFVMPSFSCKRFFSNILSRNSYTVDMSFVCLFLCLLLNVTLFQTWSDFTSSCDSTFL